jgi:hypothetical protein
MRTGGHRVFLVEHYGVDVTEEGAAALAGMIARATEGPRSGVRLLGSACVPGDESFLSLFAAPSAEVVELAVARAGITADRIVPAFWKNGEQFAKEPR